MEILLRTTRCLEFTTITEIGKRDWFRSIFNSLEGDGIGGGTFRRRRIGPSPLVVHKASDSPRMKSHSYEVITEDARPPAVVK